MLKSINQLDQEDDLKSFIRHFGEIDRIYLNGNSLGRMPLKTLEVIQEVTANEWQNGLISSWYSKWLKRPAAIAAKVAALINADEDEIFVGDSTSIQLYKLIFGALQLHPDRNEIIIDDLNFPTDYYILNGIMQQSFQQHKVQTITSSDQIHGNEAELSTAISDKTALVYMSHVAYKSAFMYDMAWINAQAETMGALTLWDLSHSAGAVPVDVKASNTNMAVGCLYKYLNGGPGAPAFLYVKKDLQDQLLNPIMGWFGHKAPFAFDPVFDPNPGIQKYAVGTPGILSLSAVEPGLDLILEAGISRLRQKSLQMSSYFIGQYHRRLQSKGYKLVSPEDAEKRGSHVSLAHDKADEIYQQLTHPEHADHKPVICDFRPPNLLRFGLAPLYNSFAEIEYCIRRLEEIAG